MSAPVNTAQGSEITNGIAAGVVVGGRFVVERLAHADALGNVLLARDEKTSKPIALRVIDPAIAADAPLVEAMREDVKAAARAKHRALAGTYGVGTHGGALFIACEWAQGSPLSELSRQRGGRPLSIRGAYNVIAHVCKALTELHQTTLHGAVRPSVVMITKSGRVKLTELGVDLALVRTGRFNLLPATEQAYLAPEVRGGQPIDRRADVFGVGGLLYVLLTGRSPSDAFVPPSQTHPDATPALDQVLLRCLAGDPAQRYGSTQEIALALLPLAAGAPEAPLDELGVEVEVDVDLATSIAPPAPRAMPASLVIAPAHASMDAIDVRMSIDPPGAMPAAPPLPGRITPPPGRVSPPLGAAPLAPPAPARITPTPAGVDFGGLMAKLTENDGPRWMVIKNGLDHGPFTARELIKFIVEGEFTEQNVLFNMDSGDKKPLAEWAELAPFVEQYRLRRDEADHAKALEKSTKIERRGNVAKLMIFAGSLGLVLLIAGGYLMSRQAAKKREQSSNVDLAAMFESGAVKVKGTAGILKHVGRSGGGTKRSGGGAQSGSSAGGFSSYEDAMNQAMEMGDATKGGGERQLTSSDVQGVMDRRLNSLFSCVSEELRRGGRLGSVQIDLAILGSGQVVGASVNAGSGAFKSCISGKVRSIKFPDFPAPRMGARYAFDVN
jgi:hypothetical protein